MLWRLLYAVIVVVLALAIIPVLARILGFPLSGDLWLLARLVIAGLAVLYILGYPRGSWSTGGGPA